MKLTTKRVVIIAALLIVAGLIVWRLAGCKADPEAAPAELKAVLESRGDSATGEPVDLFTGKPALAKNVGVVVNNGTHNP